MGGGRVQNSQMINILDMILEFSNYLCVPRGDANKGSVDVRCLNKCKLIFILHFCVCGEVCGGGLLEQKPVGNSGRLQ